MNKFKAIQEKWPDAAGTRAVRGGERSAPQGEQPWTKPELTTFPIPDGEVLRNRGERLDEPGESHQERFAPCAIP